MNFSLHPIAVKELADSIDYYEEINPGLGLEFSKVYQSFIVENFAPNFLFFFP